MRNLNIENITVEGNELNVRTGDLLPQVKKSFPVIEGIISAPSQYVLKLKDVINTLNAENHSTVITASYNGFTIKLFVEKNNPDAQIVIGRLEPSPESVVLGINNGVYITTLEMGQKLKMNRIIFESITEAVELIGKMLNFDATVSKVVASSTDNRANTKQLQEQAVTTNLPNAFHIAIPIFKGHAKEVIEVEIYIEPSSLKCTLVSPQFNEMISGSTIGIIDSELAELAEMLPEVPIIMY